MHWKRLLLGVLGAASLWSCVEHEEEIEVAADGAVTVTLRADGHVTDLADGSPLPWGGPWRALDAGTQRWFDVVGVAGPGRLERARAAFGEDVQLELALAGRFDSVEQLPATYAPAADPYASAHLQRSASLSIERRGARTVYVLERTLHGRHHVGAELFDAVVEELPEDLLADFGAATDAQLAAAATSFAELAAEYAEGFLRDALATEYVEGPATLPLASFERVLADGRARADAVLTADALRELLVRARAAERRRAADEPEGEDGGSDAFEELEQRWRAALRDALRDGLDAERVSPQLANAVRARLEWNFTAYDQTDDLGDERFRVVVRMPGRIVAGNHAQLEDGAACWEVDGKALRGADRTLRVVSVLE